MRTRTKTEKNAKGIFQHDWLQWLIVFVLLAAAIIGNYKFDYVSLPLRTLAVIVTILIAGAIALLTTKKGKDVILFSKESLVELHKVIWPTRQETTQKTLIVAAITTVMALLLWGLDAIIFRLISFITSL